MTDICFMPVIELTRAIATRDLKPTEVTEAFLGRIEDLDASLGAYTTVLHDGARQAAKRAEEAGTRGESWACSMACDRDQGPRGP